MVIESQVKTAIWRDYFALAKPRVVLLHLITAAAAMFLAARGLPSVSILLFTLLGGGLLAGASNVFNCYLDRDIDGIMVRTQNRPLPSGRLKPRQALFLGIISGIAGLFIFSYLVSWLATALAIAALAYYILIYTIWLKRRTYWSSLIGSGAGAFPPLIGWVAVTGRVEISPFVLFAIIMLWTPAHFWSLVILRRLDYESVGLGMIPAKNAPLWILVSSLVLVMVSVLLVQIAGLAYLYLSIASILGVILIVLSVRLQIKESVRQARQLYWYSLFYLMILFGAMLIDMLVFS